MCISIQIKSKTAVSIFLLFCSIMVTLYSNEKIEKIQLNKSKQVHVNCTVIDTQEINGLYHTNWKYKYNNQTYTFTDESVNNAKNHICCILLNNPFETVTCNTEQLFKFYMYMVCIWMITISYTYCAYYVCRERKNAYISSV